jgi:hypothetical protein
VGARPTRRPPRPAHDTFSRYVESLPDVVGELRSLALCRSAAQPGEAS